MLYPYMLSETSKDKLNYVTQDAGDGPQEKAPIITMLHYA